MRTLKNLVSIISLTTTCLVLTPKQAKADIIDQIVVGAAFVPYGGPFSYTVLANSAPDLSLSGGFAYDETTGAILAFHMTLSNPTSNTADSFSSSDGTGSVFYSSDTEFKFTDSRATIFLNVANGTLLPLVGTYYLSSAITAYNIGTPDNPSWIVAPYGAGPDSFASLDGTIGAIEYPYLQGNYTSGYITVISQTIPEPGESSLFIVGLAAMLGVRQFRTGRPSTSW